MIRPSLTLICFALGSIVEAATVTAIPSQASISAGQSVRVDISLSDVSDLYAFQFDLNYTPGILSAQTVTESGYFLANGVSFSPGTINNSAGRVTAIADSLSGSRSGFTGSTTLASITFLAQSGGTAQISPVNLILLNGRIASTSP